MYVEVGSRKALKMMGFFSHTSYGGGLTFLEASGAGKHRCVFLFIPGGQVGEPDPEPEACRVAQVQVLFGL